MLNRLVSLIVACAALPAAGQTAAPPLPPLVRIVVPFAPGASTDVTARALATKLSQRMGTNVIVDNRPGASGVIGADAVAKAAPDGSMLLLTSVSLITVAATKPNMPFDINRALAPVAMLAQGPMVVAVTAAGPIRTPADLVAAARSKPDALTHGTGGIGTIAHLAAESLNDAAGIQIKHIPYKGAAPALIDLASGTIDVMFAAYSTMAPQVQSGRVRLIAVTTKEPNPSFPGLPTMASAVPGYTADLWTAVFAPAGTPPALVQRFNQEIAEAMKTKEMRDLMQADAFTVVSPSPEETAQRVRESFASWKRLAQRKAITTD